MGRRATILTVGQVTEAGELARSFDDVEYAPVETFLHRQDAPEADATTIVQVGDGDPNSLAEEIVAVLRHVGGKQITVVIEEQADTELPQVGRDGAAAGGTGPLRASERHSRGEHRVVAGPARSKRPSPVARLLRKAKKSMRGTLAVWLLCSASLAMVLCMRLLAHSNDLVLAIVTLPVVVAILATPALVLRTGREVRRNRRSLVADGRRLASLRKQNRALRASLERLRAEHVRTSTAVSLMALATDEQARHQAQSQAGAHASSP